MSAHQSLIEKLKSLPIERLAEVEDFVDFLRFRENDQALAHTARAASEPAFNAVWSNPEDELYDAL